MGIDPKIPPVEITADDFDEQVDKQVSPRAKASEMEHALRYHIRKHLDEDPTHFERLSERLSGILKEDALTRLRCCVGDTTTPRGDYSPAHNILCYSKIQP